MKQEVQGLKKWMWWLSVFMAVVSLEWLINTIETSKLQDQLSLDKNEISNLQRQISDDERRATERDLINNSHYDEMLGRVLQSQGVKKGYLIP